MQLYEMHRAGRVKHVKMIQDEISGHHQWYCRRNIAGFKVRTSLKIEKSITLKPLKLLNPNKKHNARS